MQHFARAGFTNVARVAVAIAIYTQWATMATAASIEYWRHLVIIMTSSEQQQQQQQQQQGGLHIYIYINLN